MVPSNRVSLKQIFHQILITMENCWNGAQISTFAIQYVVLCDIWPYKCQIYDKNLPRFYKHDLLGQNQCDTKW